MATQWIYNYVPGVKLATGEPYTMLWMTAGIGTFTIPRDYFDTLREMGSFIGGMDSLLIKWGEFSHEATGRNHSLADILAGVLVRPVDERDVVDAKRIYLEMMRREGRLSCVWTGQKLLSFDVDHALPYSVLKNNDLWNLLPTAAPVNAKKKDKIPTPERVSEAADRILLYWNELRGFLPTRFDNEMQTALLGQAPGANWQRDAIKRVADLCGYLIDMRGFEPWN